MGFESLLGNDALKSRLRAALDVGRLAHSLLITGPAGSGKRTLARLLAASMQCVGSHPPCCACRPCRKVLDGVHPDVLVVDEPEKKQVPVELVRRARAELFIRPNEGRRKVLLFPRAQDLNASAQNALLKVLEEPPAYGAFLLLAETPEMLLPTIRSRCIELRLTPLPPALLRSELARRYPGRDGADLEAAAVRCGGCLGQAAALLDGGGVQLPQAEQFARAYAAGDDLALLELTCSLEKWKRPQLTALLEQMRGLLEQALLARQGCPVLSPSARAMAESRPARQLLAGCRAVEQALDDCRANVGVANLCAGLLVRLRRNNAEL